MRNQLLELLEKRMQQCVADGRGPVLDDKFERKTRLFERRNSAIVNVKARGNIQVINSQEDTEEVDYQVHLQYFIKQKDHFYVEEEIENRRGIFYKGILIEDKEILISPQDDLMRDLSVVDAQSDEVRYTYDRRKAVQYAEKWWNSYNPAYHQFEVDCTNYISQCVRAGGAPMRGYPNRGTGWWMQNNSWSYSWAVANAFPRYLEASKQGLRAKVVSDVSQLKLGDVICYDFEGDGKYNHTTIVTAKDGNGEPLVNAHTYNSRMRYWAYEDSTAYTPNIKYRFFSIIDGQ
ncbi:amidase domain-containing protein [Bacillales bacterium AN1005]|uniref:amidase domain-containing protein n=1 Tax=Niallia taxi TaxID=2499688 RepID=UPI0011A7FDEE|nr:amidase domain-containing protein [Niallia taxi]MCT2342505.1 amidase domain-containing protein [Niallia taxi]